MVLGGTTVNNTIVNWMQLLNLGRRIPGVVNTDAHYNFHGSGWLRNYLKSPTDDPAAIKALDVVHAAERGHLVMSSGPFLEVKFSATGSTLAEVIPGDDLAALGRKLTLKVRVQCPNWFDVDRVQVFLNGRPEQSLNFTRQSTPDRFASGVMKFDQEFPLTLDRDAHVIVAADWREVEARPGDGSRACSRPPRCRFESDLCRRRRRRLEGQRRHPR